MQPRITQTTKALVIEAVTMKVLNEYSDFRTEMNKIRILMANLPAFVKTIKGVLQLGCDANSIVSRVSNLESIEAEHKKLKESVESLTNTKRELEIDCYHLDDLTSTHTQSLATYRQLESVGIGLKELKLFIIPSKRLQLQTTSTRKMLITNFMPM